VFSFITLNSFTTPADSFPHSPPLPSHPYPGLLALACNPSDNSNFQTTSGLYEESGCYEEGERKGESTEERLMGITRREGGT